MNLIATTGQQPVTMSSREIAELVEKQHKHVLRDIEAMLAQITEPKFGLSDFLSSYTDATGRKLKEYRLPRDLTVTLITGYRADLRYRVVKRLEDLEAAKRIPDLTDPATLRGLLLGFVERSQELEAKVESMAPIVAAHERLTSTEGSFTGKDTAKMLEIGQKELFNWLYQNRWIYRRSHGSPWVGYDDKRRAGLLTRALSTEVVPIFQTVSYA